MSGLSIAGFPHSVTGADRRGFNVAADNLRFTADGVNLDVLWNEFQAVLTEWNRSRSAFAALFTSNTIDPFFDLPAGESDIEFDLQSEFGVPSAGRPNVDVIRGGLPLVWRDKSSRFTRAYLRDASAEQVRGQHTAMLEADNRRVFREVLSALTTRLEVGSRYLNENGQQIFDLWDGSTGEVPPSYAGRTFSASHSHYLVSGANQIDSKDVEDLISTIQEHGYGLTGSGERIVLLVNPFQADAIQTWRANSPNANGVVAKYDYIPSVSAPAYLTEASIVGDAAPAAFNNLAIMGSYGDAWIHKSPFVPLGYVIAVATSGPGSARNPLLIREHRTPGERGLILRRSQGGAHPLVESIYERGMGVGVRHRGAAAVMQIKATGSYENPVW